MYYIAICDEDSDFIFYIKEIMLQVGNNKTMESRIYEYSSGEALVKNSEEEVYYDLIILDMESGGKDGDEIAMLLRDRFPHSLLVCCSGVRQPTVKTLKARPFRYLLKSFKEEEFLDEMKATLEEMERIHMEPYVIGHYRNHIIKAKLKNVIYIENAKRGSKVILNPKCEEAKFAAQILIDKKLNELPEEFFGTDFAFAHSSYVVNFNHIEKLGNSEIHLDNGEILSISRRYHKKFREAFTNFVRRLYSE